MFGETARVKTEMGKKWRFDNSRVLSHDDTCQLIRETSKAKDRKFWCDDEDAQAIELPVRCRGMIHRTYPIYATGQMIIGQKQYSMIMTCRVECHDQRNRRERKGKILVFDDGDVQTSDEDDSSDDDDDDDDNAAAPVALPDLHMSGT